MVGLVFRFYSKQIDILFSVLIDLNSLLVLLWIMWRFTTMVVSQSFSYCSCKFRCNNNPNWDIVLIFQSSLSAVWQSVLNILYTWLILRLWSAQLNFIVKSFDDEWIFSVWWLQNHFGCSTLSNQIMSRTMLEKNTIHPRYRVFISVAIFTPTYK